MSAPETLTSALVRAKIFATPGVISLLTRRWVYNVRLNHKSLYGPRGSGAANQIIMPVILYHLSSSEFTSTLCSIPDIAAVCSQAIYNGLKRRPIECQSLKPPMELLVHINEKVVLLRGWQERR